MTGPTDPEYARIKGKLDEEDQERLLTQRAIQELPRMMTGLYSQLEKIAENTKKDSGLPHLPAVAPGRDGTWGVFCLACSEDASDYVPLCAKLAENGMEWPSTVLHVDVNRKAIHSLEAVRRIAAGVLLDTPAGDPRQFVAQQIITALDDSGE